MSNLAIGMLWKGKTREIVIMNFMILAILETVASVLLGIWLLFVSYDVWVMAVASIVGFITATCLMPSLELAIAFWSLACIFDDIGWICIYVRTVTEEERRVIGRQLSLHDILEHPDDEVIFFA